MIRADPSSIGDILATARLEGFDFAFVDCPPHAVAGTAALLRHADHVVTPVQPTMPDITAAQRSVALIAAAGKPFSFVINRAPARAADVCQAREVLPHAGPVSPIVIGDRRVYARALTSSLAVPEYARDDEKAVLEVLYYWLWLDAHHLVIDICKRKAA